MTTICLSSLPLITSTLKENKDAQKSVIYAQRVRSYIFRAEIFAMALCLRNLAAGAGVVSELHEEACPGTSHTATPLRVLGPKQSLVNRLSVPAMLNNGLPRRPRTRACTQTTGVSSGDPWLQNSTVSKRTSTHVERNQGSPKAGTLTSGVLAEGIGRDWAILALQ